MNDTTFQGDGKIAFVPVVVNAKQPKQTNADRIRAMTDEELAWELCRILRMPFYKDDSDIDEYEVDCWAKWLKQEVEDGKDG